MKKTSWMLLTGLLAIAALFTAEASAELKTIGTDEIRPGMKGYGLTVFEGVAPEKFEVEVVSVVPNFLLRQDIILIRCKHPVTDRAGVIGGMSGSPIYIDGRLAGALAYGWRFGKEPLAGVTAIEDMLKVARRKARGRDHAAGANPLAILGRGLRELLNTPRPRRAPIAPARSEYFELLHGRGDALLTPARTPLSLGGFLETARRVLSDALDAFGLEPMTGGGAGDGSGPAGFEPGGAIGVQLIRGDMSATGIGTVTAVRGDQVLAFGHPMFNMGEAYLPVTTARIHTVVASLARSNKLGSPAREVGTLIQDRTAGIVAQTGRRAPMIPMTVEVIDKRSGIEDTYEVEVVSHRILTPELVFSALVNIISHAASDAADVTAQLEGTLEITGRPPVHLRDSGASRSGLVSLTRYFRPIGVIAAVLNNPFETVDIERIRFRIELRYDLDVAQIVGAYVTAGEPEPGETINVHVRLRHYGGKERLLTAPITIPESAAGQKVELSVAGGDYITPVMPNPQNLDDLIRNVGRFYPPMSFVVELNLPSEGVTLRGRVLENLPSSAVDALQPSAGAEQVARHQAAWQKVEKTPYLVEGEHSIKLEVAERRIR